MCAQKTGDIYNYEVAAYLKVNKADYAPYPPFNLTNYSFNANPRDVISNLSNQPVSIDLIISNALIEYLIECKHSELPRPLSLNSPEFKDAILEFLALENYRHNQFRTVACMLIVNMPKRKLEEERLQLRNNPQELPTFIDNLLKYVPNKWKNFNGKIMANSVLEVLNELIILEIDDGAIKQAKIDERFKTAFNSIIETIPETQQKLVPMGVTKKPQIQLIGQNKQLVSVKESQYVIRISTDIIDEISSFQNGLKGYLVRATTKDLPFLKTSDLTAPHELPADTVALLVTQAINDLTSEKCFVSLFYPKQFEIYFADKGWAVSTVKSLRDKDTGKFSNLRYENSVGSVPPYVSEFLIRETKRLMEGIIINKDRLTSGKQSL